MIRRPPRSTLFPYTRSSDLKRKVEVEVETLAEFEEALQAAPDIILLDEFSHADMKTAVEINRSKGRPVRLEASGDRKSTRLNSSHANISYAVFCLEETQ